MTTSGRKVSIALGVSLLVAGVLVWGALYQAAKPAAAPTSRAPKAVPVEVASVQRGPMTLKRTFSGALDARAQFVVAPKIGGRVEQIHVRLADTVRRGQVVAELDNDELVQAIARTQAEMQVAVANVAGAQSALDIATRELGRMSKLRERGIASEAQYDTARAHRLDKRSQLDVAKALVSKSQAELRSAKIRLGYTQVAADWSGGSDRRIVAERFVDEGETVSANQELLRIVELDPILAIVYVTERDYARLVAGKAVALATDAYPGLTFDGRIARIAPVFREATRQARVEVTVPNKEQHLKPGMFIRATIVLDRVPDAVHVPEQAITARNGESGVFVVNGDGRSVTWRKVEVGIRDGRRVQVSGEGVSGRVVVLGQQLLENGSAILLSAGDDPISTSSAAGTTR